MRNPLDVPRVLADFGTMIKPQRLSLIRRLSQIGTMLNSLMTGVKVGDDAFGNRYYRARRTPKGLRERRWVIYAGETEASLVPPEWHGWLHHTMASPLLANSPFHQSWQQPHLPNQTGTEAAYYPSGHRLSGGKRAASTSDYEAWSPEQSSH
jgi:NADH:ubiquinone oxidoreductase subunit